MCWHCSEWFANYFKGHGGRRPATGTGLPDSVCDEVGADAALADLPE